MANIVIQSLDSSIRIDFNDFSSKYKTKSITTKKDHYGFQYKTDGGVIITIEGYFKIHVYWNTLSIVDSVNGVAPTSDQDLYEKLTNLMISSNNLTTLIDEASSTVTYIGKAIYGSSTASAVWSISKMDTSSGTNIKWADGNGYFDNIWNNRAIYTYS